MRCRDVALAALLISATAHADDGDHTARLADAFYAAGQYYRAITAYEELALFAPDEPTKLRAAIRIAMSYHKGHQLDDAILRYRDAITLAKDPDLARTLRIQLALARVERNFDQPGSDALDVITAELAPSATDAFGIYELARIEGLAGHRADAKRTLGGLHAACVTTSAACSLEPALTRALDRSPPGRRSPWLGVAMSAVVPGTGSIYGGNVVDGIYYFALTALPALGAYDIYDGTHAWTNQKTTFYGLATVAVVFYATNILSSYIAVSRHNAVTELDSRRALWRDTELAMPLDEHP